jgi:hypothetical protein
VAAPGRKIDRLGRQHRFERAHDRQQQRRGQYFRQVPEHDIAAVGVEQRCQRGRQRDVRRNRARETAHLNACREEAERRIDQRPRGQTEQRAGCVFPAQRDDPDNGCCRETHRERCPPDRRQDGLVELQRVTRDADERRHLGQQDQNRDAAHESCDHRLRNELGDGAEAISARTRSAATPFRSRNRHRADHERYALGWQKAHGRIGGEFGERPPATISVVAAVSEPEGTTRRARNATTGADCRRDECAAGMPISTAATDRRMGEHPRASSTAIVTTACIVPATPSAPRNVAMRSSTVDSAAICI